MLTIRKRCYLDRITFSACGNPGRCLCDLNTVMLVLFSISDFCDDFRRICHYRQPHEERENLIDWYGRPFDREDIQPDTINIAMGRLANMRQPKK